MATKKSVPKKPLAAKAVSKRVKKPVLASAPKKVAAKVSKTTAKTPVAARRNPIAHHAKRLYHLTPKFIHGMVTGAFIGIVTVLTLNAVAPVSALNLPTELRDKDSNAVMTGGALSTTELKNKYSNKGVSTIYTHFGISAAEVTAMSSTAVVGLVWDNGNVSVNGKVVATDAITAGRENISGSTKVTIGSVTFYKRSPKISFNRDALTSFVVMKDGVFQFAIIGACGNPVTATAIPKEKPKPVAPTPKPTPPVTTTTTSTQTPPSTPIATVASQPAPAPAESLPQTGPGAVVVVAVLAVIGGYVFHMTHRHIRHKRHTSHSA
jgi:hypothetical protein